MWIHRPKGAAHRVGKGPRVAVPADEEREVQRPRMLSLRDVNDRQRALVHTGDERLANDADNREVATTDALDAEPLSEWIDAGPCTPGDAFAHDRDGFGVG